MKIKASVLSHAPTGGAQTVSRGQSGAGRRKAEVRGGPGLGRVLHHLLWGWSQAEPFEVGGEKAGGGRAADFHTILFRKRSLVGSNGGGGLRDGLAAAPSAAREGRGLIYTWRV